MKKVALVVALIVLVVAASGEAGVTDDKEFRAGLKQYNSRNYQAAVQHFKAYAAHSPHPAALYLIGYSLYKLGKFSEADEYFREAFFIDPEFSLEKAGLIRNLPHEQIVRGPTTPAPRAAEPDTKSLEPSAPSIKEASPIMPQPVVPDEKMRKAPEPVMPPPARQEPASPGKQAAPLPQPSQPAPAFPQPKPGVSPTGPAAGLLAGLLGGMLLFTIILGIALYLFFSFCLYKIAQKLGVPDAWLAFVPLISLWTFVSAAGKPGWWVLLFLVPIVNAFVGIYLWMCITENLGKNKWMGLLVLVPVIGFFYPAWLAFSKTDSHSHIDAGETLA